ncbi:hypothetical protein B0I35DRAFT_476565 [Stachybotrys elegans]|uniref:Uncharacterized protein n=1 Tax=Stachybotrys elegans TaxID=80388 RepID=A0A8K0T0S9_9HYPO|nr:hypothetical protein B0I35DRAFT_476565 [Stachybotrys elegans]
MDFIKDAVSKATSGSGNKDANQNKTGDGQMDFIDKAWDAASKKAGHDFDRSTDEKITDAARDAYKKYSGKDVSDKISN